MRCLTLVLPLLIFGCSSTAYGFQLAAESNTAQSADEDRAAKLKAYRDALTRPYEKSRTLQDAVVVLKSQLVEANLAMYQPLLTVESVKHAISKSVTSMQENYASQIERAKTEAGRRVAELAEQRFSENIAPLFDHMVDTGSWVPASYFNFVPGEEKYSGVSISLHISAEYEIAPGLTIDSFAIPIVEVNYGMKSPQDDRTTTFEFSTDE